MDQDKINDLWRRYCAENSNPNVGDFIGVVARELKCSLTEAEEKSSHLLLTE